MHGAPTTEDTKFSLRFKFGFDTLKNGIKIEKWQILNYKNVKILRAKCHSYLGNNDIYEKR